MPEAAHQGAEKLPVKWLTAAEVDSWLSVVRLMTWLPWSIDQQLRREHQRIDAGARDSDLVRLGLAVQPRDVLRFGEIHLEQEARERSERQ